MGYPPDRTATEIEGEPVVPCPNGCLGQAGDNGAGKQVPAYCNVNGCEMERPGYASRSAARADAEREGE